jgi:hypothetical protein
MHSIVVFGLLRYREFLEHNGFLETHFNSTDIFNPQFSNAEGEEFFARQITMMGKVEQKFIRGLHRNIENVLFRDRDPNAVTPSNPQGFEGGIRILSNLDTPVDHRNDTNWWTDADIPGVPDDELD